MRPWARNKRSLRLIAAERRCLVLESESLEAFDAVLAEHIDRLQPVDVLEYTMVEDMVACYWRSRRAWAIETRMQDKQIAAQDEGGDLDRAANALCALAETPAPVLMHRYDGRLHMVYTRSLHTFLLVQELRSPNEP
jgi:hypothetical protein